MNKRILELAEQAGTDTSGKWMSIDNVEEFSKLMVKDCCNVLLQWKNEPFPFDENLACSLIKEHFGIK
jgi:hypothetical protein